MAETYRGARGQAEGAAVNAVPDAWRLVPARSPGPSHHRGRRPVLQLPGVQPIARAAVPAAPLRVDVGLAEVLEDGARVAARRLAVGDHRVELAAVEHAALLVVGEVLAEVHLEEPRLQ